MKKRFFVSGALLFGLVGTPILETYAEVAHLPVAATGTVAIMGDPPALGTGTEIAPPSDAKNGAPRKTSSARRTFRERRATVPVNEMEEASVPQEGLRREIRRRRAGGLDGMVPEPLQKNGIAG